MPQLSDSMEEGKLISWKVKEGQKVNVGDVIAEVESDKAVMEVQTFKSGVVEKLLAKEGDEVPVGKAIAVLDVASKEEKSQEVKEKEVEEPKKEKKPQKPKEQPKQEEIAILNILENAAKSSKKEKHEKITGISPKAKAKAMQYGVDIKKVIEKTSKSEIHAKDIDEYLKSRYFTPKALKLLDEYELDFNIFNLDHKIDETEVKEYIEKNEIPLPKPLSSMQKAIILNVEASAKKPVYHIYENIDAELFLKHEEHSITAWLIKIFAKVMMKYDSFRSSLKNEKIIISPNASISVAVADEKNLYMPVIKDANKLSIKEISQKLQDFKTKLKEKSFVLEDLQGSNFGISNLGMLRVERFDAMINKDDSAIAAIGTLKDNLISVTLTIDHRLINGYEAALFMKDLKAEAKNPINFKEKNV